MPPMDMRPWAFEKDQNIKTGEIPYSGYSAKSASGAATLEISTRIT